MHSQNGEYVTEASDPKPLLRIHHILKIQNPSLSVFLKLFSKICGIFFLITFNYAPIELVQISSPCLPENHYVK